MVVLRCVHETGMIRNPWKESPVGKYVASYDPEANDGQGAVEWSPDQSGAMKFETGVEALELWRAVPKNRPLRSDGKPNRPLTAFSMELVEIDG